MKHSRPAGLIIVAFLLCVWGWFLFRQRALPPQKIVSPVQDSVIRQTAVAPAIPLARNALPRTSTNTAVFSDPPAPIAPPTANQPAAMTDFSNWVEQFLAGNASASLAQGEALAWKRRQAMLELIETDPARAIELAAPFRWRQLLPEKITRHFEQRIDARGSYEVAMAEANDDGRTLVYRWAVIGDRRYDAFVYGRRLRQSSRARIPLHGVAIGRKLALHSDPIRILEPDEALAREAGRRVQHTCSVCSQPINDGDAGIAADLGGETAYFCGSEHFSLVNQRWQLAESSVGGGNADLTAGGGSTWTQGRKNVLYMRVNFPDDLTEPISEANAYSVMNAVNQFYVTGSYDTTWLTATVTPLLTLPQTKNWYGDSNAGPGSLLSDARAVARNAGFDTANYDLDIAAFTTVPGFDWGGLGAVGGKGVWLQSPGVGVTAHELGHNYGLPHANFWDTLTNSGYSVIGPGTNNEYGNVFDTMGSGGGQFSAFFKNSLGWLPDSTVQDIISNGVYRIYPFDVPQRAAGRFYAAKVHKDFERDYWMEFRQSPASTAMQNGLLLNWSPWSQSSNGLQMLDTTINTLDRSDSAVVVGRTFNDAAAGVHITPVARGTTGSDPWIDVQVNLGIFPANSPPSLGVEATPTNAAPGQLVRLHATASDPDGDALAYAWTFDDGTFSVNNESWASKSWTQPGEHVVRCVVSDMKGGTASANIVVTVGSPVGFHIRGVVLDENDEPVEGVRVDNDINTTTGYVSSFTDSDGGFILTGITTNVALMATKYGYTFTNVGWDNPLTSSVVNITFLATPLTNVGLTLSTNTVAENGAGGQLTLTRSDQSTNDLTVTLMVSGSASLPADMIFSPPLSSGINSVVIPGNTNRITFSFTPVNDGIVEGTESVFVTILDYPYPGYGYVIAPSAEGRIDILDDDQPPKPEVSVAAGNSSVTESSADNGSFVFSRTGSASNSLTLFYTVGGTATPGTDYPTLVGVVVIPAGRSSTTVEFHPIDDKDVEPDETVVVTLTANAAYTIVAPTATVTIVDDDLLVVTVAPTDSNLAEPSSPGRFTIKRDGDQSANLVVYYTMSGTATNGVDYVSPSGAVTIPAGQTSAEVVITPIDDLLLEGDESVVLTLTSSPGYDIGIPASATLILRDNEKTTVTVTAPDANASEPGSDFGTFMFSRGSVINGDLTVNFIVNGTAINGVDYVPLDNFVVIPNGSSSVTLDVIPFDDLQLESTNEDVIITLVASTNYNLGTPHQARVVIADDDPSSVPAVGFTFSSSSAPEHESPGISVSLSETSSVPITVSFRVIGGTASSNDYTLPSKTLTFDPGERAKSLPLMINDDAIIEPNETIRLTLYDPTNATLDGIKIHTYTIIDNDSASVSVSATANAFEAGQVPGNFRITRTGSTNADLTVGFQLTGTASAPGDYASPGNSATIPAGATFVDVPIVPVDDATVELDQTLVLTLFSAPGGKIVPPNAATLTIFDNDPESLPVVSVSSTNQPYAIEGGSNGAFVFTRTGSTTGALTVNFTISGTATSGLDYTALPNSVVIPSGQSSFTLPVVAIDDGLIEGDETVVVTLSIAGSYRSAFPSTATVTILDNDQIVRIDASDFQAAEPGTDRGAFTFTRSGSTLVDVQVFFTISGTASNGVDYAAITNSFVIPAGSQTATLPIIPLDDPLVEGPETVTLTLQTNAAYTIGSPTNATVTILDDEPSVSIIAVVPDVTEGSRQPGVFRVLRGGNPDYEFTARLAVGGTATYGVDYPPFLTNIVFNCGIVSVDLSVFPTNEAVVEPNETVNVSIVPNPAYSILSPSNATVLIHDAGTNIAPVVTITSPTADTVYLLGTNVNLILEATVLDEGDTNTTVVTINWTNISGPDALVFNATNPLNATVSFTNGGVYVLRLTADDGVLTNYADLTVVVDTFGLLSSNLLHWALDEGSGTNLADSSGNGHAGVVNGPAGWVTNGVLGAALRLNGTNNLIREAVDSALLQGRKQFSLALWVKADTTNSSRGIFTADSSGTNATQTLATKISPSCGSGSNVVEATFAATRGQTHRVSASNRITNQWQHIALSWTNGLPPQLFVNGIAEQSQGQGVVLRGALTNCPQFIVGLGPPGLARWAGYVDDVRVFGRALSAVEIMGFTATNYGPIVTVATNLTVQIATPVELSGTVTDDGRLNPPGFPSNTWVQIDGPVMVPLPDPNNLTNTVSFTQSGNYVFRLIADDGQVKVYQDLGVTVVEPTLVYVFASDPEAAELGPDTGEFTFMRVGDLNFDLSIQVVLAGTASNALDYVLIPQSNTVVIPFGIDTTKITVTPFLDHRTEGDEMVTYTIVSNAAYTIGSGQAAVTIHDSPYGMWNIAHFTLEELTDPKLSGEDADFDHDRHVNFVEYAMNRDPKVPETTPLFLTSIETNHITFTYQRRLEPTDVSYEVSVANSVLGPWLTGTNYIEEVQVTDDGNGLTETVKSRVVAPWPPVPPTYFIQLRVWLRATGP